MKKNKKKKIRPIILSSIQSVSLHQEVVKTDKQTEYESSLVKLKELQVAYNKNPNFIQKNAILLDIQKLNNKINVLEGELHLKTGFLQQ